MIPLPEFWDELEKHDWFFEMSDCHYTYNKGKESYYKLQILAAESEEHMKLFSDFSKHMFTGKPWGTEKQPKPERPEE